MCDDMTAEIENLRAPDHAFDPYKNKPPADSQAISLRLGFRPDNMLDRIRESPKLQLNRPRYTARSYPTRMMIPDHSAAESKVKAVGLALTHELLQ